jgi:hypothetical protein
MDKTEVNPSSAAVNDIVSKIKLLQLGIELFLNIFILIF